MKVRLAWGIWKEAVAMYPRTVYSTRFSVAHNNEDGLRCEAVRGYNRAGACGSVSRVAENHQVSVVERSEQLEVVLGALS